MFTTYVQRKNLKFSEVLSLVQGCTAGEEVEPGFNRVPHRCASEFQRPQHRDALVTEWHQG